VTLAGGTFPMWSDRRYPVRSVSIGRVRIDRNLVTNEDIGRLADESG
jgi:hypothetical protein